MIRPSPAPNTNSCRQMTQIGVLAARVVIHSMARIVMAVPAIG